MSRTKKNFSLIEPLSTLTIQHASELQVAFTAGLWVLATCKIIAMEQKKPVCGIE
jgi:hypothetical protein